MATKSVVVPSNLGPEFLIGTETPNKITVGVATPLKKDATGKLTVDLTALAATTTNTAALTGSSLTSTVNGIAATTDLTPAIKAAETTTVLSYAAATGILSYTDEDGVVTAIDLPMENVLTAPTYNAGTNVLTFTKPDGSTILIDLTDLMDIYSLTAGNGITVTGNGSTATPWVVAAKVDPAVDNALTVSATGLKVVVPAPTNTLTSTVNTLTSTVTGIAATAPIINSNVLAAGATAGTIKATVNGVASNDLNIGAIVRPLADIEVQDAFGVTQYYAFSTNV